MTQPLPSLGSARIRRALLCMTAGLAALAAGCTAVPVAETTTSLNNPESIKLACRELVMRYAVARDQRTAEAFANLFTADATLVVNGQEIRGHAQLRARLAPGAGAPDTTHLVSSVVIDPLTSTTAQGLSYVSVYLAEPTAQAPAAARLAAVGEYRDQYRFTEDGWRIARREFTPRALFSE